MAGIADVAALCVADAQAAVKSVTAFNNKTVFNVYDVDELLTQATGIQFPAAGVVYEGLRSYEKGQKTTHRIGLDAELILSIVLLYSSEAQGFTQNRLSAVQQLDLIRGAMKDRYAPTGHYWRFMIEAAAAQKGGNILWLQRWTTPAILT